MWVLVLIAAVAAAPSPAPSPLKTIVHVRSSPFCTALRESVGVAVRGLLVNDRITDSIGSDLIKIARDSVLGGELVSSFNSTRPAQLGENAGMTLDLNGLDIKVRAIVHNVEIADKALNDSGLFPKNPKTDDDRALAQLKGQIQTVATRQLAALNAVTGPSETYRLSDMLWLPDNTPSANGRLPANFNATNHFAGGPMRGPADGLDPSLAPLPALPSNSGWARFYEALLAAQKQTQLSEMPLAMGIREATVSCNNVP